MTTVKSSPPPPGIYVPAVVFFDENDELDIKSTQAHVLRLAKVMIYLFLSEAAN